MDQRAASRFIMVVVLIDMMSIGIIIPVFPVLVGDFTTGLAEQAFWYGTIMLTFAVANFLASPILGALSDRYGRRPVLLLGFCGMAFSLFVTAFATHLWMLVAVRLVSGTTLATVAVANAYMADVTPPQDRGHRFGQLGAMISVGYILGPALGGLLGSIDMRLPFFVAGTLALVNLLYGYYVLPESLPADRRRPLSLRSANPVASLLHLSRLKNVGALVAVICCAGLAMFVMQNVWVLYNGFRFGWQPFENGASLFLFGVVSMLVQGFLLKHLLKLFGAPRLVVMGLVSSMLALLLSGLATSSWMMYAIIVANILAFAVAPTVNSLMSAAADAKTQGQTMGAVASLNSLTGIAAPPLAAALLGRIASLPPTDWRVGFPFFVCASLQLLSVLFAALYMRHRARATTVAEAVASPKATG